VYDALAKLEELNTKCRIHLTKLLSTQHGIGLLGEGEGNPGRISRGGAYFAAYDPWDTCWRFPPGSFRFFDMAERTGLIPHHSAIALSKALLDHGAEIASDYQGCFSPVFDELRIKTILNEVDDLEHLSVSGLAVSGSWADRLYEACPIPVIPEKHLQSLTYVNVALPGEVEFYSETPWLAWIEALDLICIGPWLGLKPREIIQMITALRQTPAERDFASISNMRRTLGHKVAIPFFSNGLQGIVFGFFHSLDKSKRNSLYTTLVQFGQTLADAYSRLRMEQLASALDQEIGLEQLAKELIQVVSPVQAIVVSKGPNQIGYRLRHEHKYWAGYQPLTESEIGTKGSDLGFEVEGPEDISIYIEPLVNVPNFHHQFTHIRLETYLRQCFGVYSGVRGDTVLQRTFVEQLHAEFTAMAGENGASLAKRRQSFIVSRVKQHWDQGRAKITNVELKRFLEEALGKEIKSGYQVTSYAAEVSKIFDHRVGVAKTRNALTLSWHPGE
jgi:hypothetical protein